MIKNTASQKIGAQMVSATDGSAFTGSVTVAVCGDAGTQATGSVGSGACVHEGNGYHTYSPAQAETNYDLIAFTFTGTGAIPQTVQVFTKAGDAFTRLGAPVGASISADIAAVQADTDNIQTRLPAALVSGRIDASVGAMASGVLTATAIDADAITDAKVASDVTIASVTGAVGSVTGAVGSVTGNVGGNVTGSVGSVVGAVGSVTGNVGGNVTGSVGSVATGGITAASLAADTITAAKLAADVTTELQTGLATASAVAAISTTLGSAGAGLTAVPWNAAWDAEVESEVADALEATIADSIPSDGTRPSVKQALYILTQHMLERSVSGTTVTIRKPDGSTTLLTLTLNDATSPTSVTRAS